MKITVIGCGAGAFATAGDLSLRGHDITLYVDKSHEKNFEIIKDTKSIVCYGDYIQGIAKIDKVTCNIKEALEDYDLIFVVTPTFAHESIAKNIALYIKENDNIILSPGSTGGALVFAKVFKDMKIEKNIKISEIHTLPYTARKVGVDGVNILLKVNFLLFSVFPSKYNKEVYDIVKELYPSIILCNSVLETSLNNGNATTHPAPVVLNAGKIEYYGKHNHYLEGITPSVSKVVQNIDDERKNICKAFKYPELDIKDRLYKMGYCPKKDTLYEAIQEKYFYTEGPNTLDHRYLTEDTPYSLVAMSNIAKIAKVETPLMDSIINLAGALMDKNYWVIGRNLHKMGIYGMSLEDLKMYVKDGKL